MNDAPYIDVAEMRRITDVRELTDTYQLRTDRPLVWLQRVCLWMLRRLGCFVSVNDIRIERHVFGKKGRTFMERLWERRMSILGTFDMQPTRLLIGPEEYAEIMHEAVSTASFGFDAEYGVGNGPLRQPTVMGLRVEVIPWMRGMLLLR